MLLEAVRQNMGKIDTNYAGEKKARMLNKSENGLGTKVLAWMGEEIARWGQALGIIDSSGNVVPAISIDSKREHPQSHLSLIHI